MTRKPKPDPSPPASGKLARVLKFVAGATAILSLVFGIRQATIYVADYRDRQHRVSELLAVAELQRASRDYRAAWTSLREAASLGARNETVQTRREDLAMDWLENASSSQGLTLGILGDSLAPVLSRGAVAAHGPRRGDLVAHLGWADFLRWRDGQRHLDPAARYRQALAADTQNVYAHTMLAHWLLWGSDSLAAASRHFAAALASGRQRPYVRHMELAALANAHDAARDLEMLRVANDMRASNDSIDAAARSRLWNVYRDQFVSSAPAMSSDQLAAAVPPAALLLTYRWLFATSGYVESKGMLYTYQLARLQEAAGDSAQALATYRLARAQAVTGYGDYRPRIDAAIVRLSRPR